MDQSHNPLKQYFRQPAIYIRLPSGGQFWGEGSLQLPINQEFPVLPMTAIDEITYRTPDALYNGQAVVSVIESCLPNVKDAWQCPTVDLDTILVAIRIASFGHSMSMTTKCPKCSNEADYEVDLRNILDNLKPADYSRIVELPEMQIYFKPLSYKQTTDNSIRQFEEQKVLNVIPDSDLKEEEKLARLNQAVSKLTELTVDTLSQCISMIRTPSAQVVEPEFIYEFLKNASSQTFNLIRDHVIALRESNEIRPLKIVCSECGNNYDQAITLDQASFFENAS